GAKRAGGVFVRGLPFERVAGFQPLAPVNETKPAIVDEKSEGLFLEYSEPFTWSQDILVLADAKPGVNVLPFKIALRVCDEKSCLNGDHGYELALNVTDSPPVPLTEELKRRMLLRPEIKVLPESQLRTLGSVGTSA